MRLTARLELLACGRVARLWLAQGWQLGAWTCCGMVWVAFGPLRLTVQARRVMWEDR